jgi:hypothetical protein
MMALLARRRLNPSAVESVDDHPQAQQIIKAAEVIRDVITRRRLSRLPAPVGPVGRNE